MREKKKPELELHEEYGFVHQESIRSVVRPYTLILLAVVEDFEI
jgi:hypothetical protein